MKLKAWLRWGHFTRTGGWQQWRLGEGDLYEYEYWYVWYQWFGHWRRLRTTHERRWNLAAPETMVRGRRRNLPSSYDDKHFSHGSKKSWKLRSRCRKQWEVNL